MSDQVLMTASCDAAHEWDVWGEETPGGGGMVRVNPTSLECPTCEPLAYATSISHAEALA